MLRSINLCSGATSRSHIKCTLSTCTEYKCSSTSACSRAGFVTRNSVHQSIPIMFSGAPGTPAPSRAPLQSAAILPMAGAPWLSQVTPYPSAFMAPLAWPMYIPSYLPKPVAQQSSMQAECEELDRQRHDLEARELEVEQLTRALNLNLNVRDA